MDWDITYHSNKLNLLFSNLFLMTLQKNKIIPNEALKWLGSTWIHHIHVEVDMCYKNGQICLFLNCN
jgi:hypothetical protein